ncbi:iron chelate uptake ABC transporter family permease subunit [Humidisolicoccus flavus]|uniref:iron chelate uptake ABC transporter family permease subunit n=1 Tax=Humidisolicoccus flavus TaxID=3111414 RepID=UPI0032522450
MTSVVHPTMQVPLTQKRRTAKRIIALLIAVFVLLTSIALSIVVGSGLLSIDTVWNALTIPDGSASHTTVNTARVHRTLIGLAVGIGLGVSGALIQALTRNPLADPGILGVNAGAGFAIVIGVAFFGVQRIGQYLPLACIGALLAVTVVYLIASGGRGAPSPLRLTLVGIAFSAVLTGISQTLALMNVQTFDRMRFWGAGTIADRPEGTFAAIAPLIVIGVLLAAVSARSLNALALGEELARSVGVRIVLTRMLVVAAVTLLCGAATAAAGPIVFVGLMVPHIVRWATGPDWRWILVFCVVLAPAFVLLADVLGRVLVLPSELQVGVVTALIGAPILVFLVRRVNAKSL